MSRTASPFASTTTTPTFMAPTNLFSGMSDRSSSVGGNSIHNVNPDGLERTITPYPEEETTSLDANQNERGTRIGQGTSSDGQTGDNAPGSATPSGSGASQQSSKMRQRLCKELSDMFNDDRSLYKLIHLGESTENREGNGFVGHVSIELRDHECNHQCGGSDPLLFQQCAEIIIILKLLDRINIDGQSLLSGAMPEYSPKRLLRHFVTVLMSAINRNRQQRGKAELTQSEQDELQEQLIAFICTTKFQGLADEYSNTIHFLASAPQQTFLMRCLILFSCAISNACRSKKISAELYNGNSRFPRYMSFGPTPSVQKRYPWVHQMLVSSSTEPQFAELKQLEEQLLAVLQATDRMNTNPISNVNELNNMLDEYVDMFYPLTVSQRPITNNSSSNSNSSTATAPATAQPRRSTRSRTKQSARTADEQSLN
ncbi:hypothetical protein GQ42DRAFT_165874 [Ramicandelaber brevisporus]|nr:hypothetical protein GQ42DRAFT_165874 [Ramicandelaber brevisporus]